MNNILEMKKHKLEQHYVQGLGKAMDTIESEKEMKGYSDFLKRFWLKVFIFIMGLGAGLWIADVMACGGLEQQSVEIKTVPRI